MNRVLIDILDSTGQKLGAGPIVTCLDWRQTARLNRAGEFSFSMPAADSRAAECRPKRFVRCWLADGAGLRQIGMGRIERVALRETDTGPMLDVSGVDLLGELADRLVLRTSLREEIEEHPSYVAAATDQTSDSTLYWYDNAIGDTTTTAALEIDDLAGTPFVIGSIYKFHKLHFVISGTVNDSHTITFQYSSEDTWKDLDSTYSLVDGTIGASGKGLEQTGDITFTPPSDWESATGENLYKIKIAAAGGDAAEEVDIYDITITYYGPTNDALDQVIDYAPAGWSLDAALGYTELQYRPMTGTELITGGDFEDYVTNGANQEFTGWTNSIYGTANINADTTNEYGGAACVKLTTTGATGGSTDYALVYQTFAVTGSTEYTLTFWARGDGTHDGQWRVQDNDIAGGDGYITNTLDTCVTGTTWTQINQTFATPAGTTSLRVNFFSPIEGSGAYCLVDDVSLQAGGGNTIYLQCSGESVLEMLTRIADVSGENFILSPSGRKVLWLGTDERTLNLRAVSLVDPIAVEDEDTLCLITSITELEDASEVVTRIYPYGSGMGASRVTLANATTLPPSGYTMSTSSNYVQHDAAVTALGVIETERSWADIVEQSADTTSAAESASNILMIQAVNWLATHTATSTDRLTGDVPRFYTLSIAKCNQLVLPGYKLRVTHHRYINNYHAVAIDADLWITAATWRVGLNGAATVALDVATVPRPAVNDALALATSIRRIIGIQAHNTAVGY